MYETIILSSILKINKTRAFRTISCNNKSNTRSPVLLIQLTYLILLCKASLQSPRAWVQFEVNNMFIYLHRDVTYTFIVQDHRYKNANMLFLFHDSISAVYFLPLLF